MTQEQLAEQAAVSVGTLRDLEQGRTARPRRDTAEALSVVLGLDLDEMAAAAGWPSANSGGLALDQPAAPAAGVWLGVLGPLTAWRDGAPADPGARRQRAMLGLLAVHPGSGLHRETIIDVVWGHEPPASAVAMVQSHASRLRQLLGKRVLASDGTSYRLVLTAAELDALEFARLADRARAAATAGSQAAACGWYEQALRLWRGEPLADVGIMRGHPAVTELAQQRTVVIVEYAAAAAAAGVPDRALPRLRAVAAQDPLDERVHARLMLTLAACGQQAAALAVFQQIRHRLSDELGVVPGAELARAHLRILRADLSSPGDAVAERVRAAPSVVHDEERHQNGRGSPPLPRLAQPRQLPLAVPHFTGRASELAELSELARAAAGSKSTVVISTIGGMAGVGKTALALHWAQQAAASFPDGQLYASLRGFDPAGAPAAPGEVIRGFLDALGVRSEEIPAGLDAQAGLYRTVTAGRRLLIVLDNAASEQQVRPLLPSSRGCLVLITSRHQLAGLSATEGARLITLDVLTEADARALLATRLGPARAAADPAAVTQIARLCGHLPLALAVTAAHAAARPRLTLAALADELRDARRRLAALDTGDPAASVRAAFSWSYAQLSPAAARTFRLLGLHPGPDISLPAAASLAGEPLSQTALHLAELARAHLATESSPGRYAMHDLLRAYAAGQAEATEDREARHEAIGRILDHYLHTACTASLLLKPSRDPIAIERRRPGVTAEQPADYPAAMAWFEAEHHVLLACARMAAATPFGSYAWQLSWAMSGFLNRRGYWHDWLALLRTALEAAAWLGDEAGQAVIRRLAASACDRLGYLHEARVHAEDSLRLYRRLGDRIGEARCHQALGVLDDRLGHVTESLAHNEHALRLFQAAGHRAGQAEMLNFVGWASIQLGQPQQGLAYCRQALALLRGLGDQESEAHTWDSLGYAEHQLGHLSDAARCYRYALALFQELGYLREEGLTHIRLGDCLQAMEDKPAAREAWACALAILDGLHDPGAEEARTKLGP